MESNLDVQKVKHTQLMASVLRVAKEPNEANWEACHKLIADGADINLKLSNGLSVIGSMIVNRNDTSVQRELAVTKALLDLGANPREMNDYNQNLLLMCADTNKDLVAKLLVERGADINQEDMEGVSPLTASIYRKNDEMVEFYLNNPNIDLEQVDGRNNTPLHIAAMMGNSTVASMLIERNPELIDKCNEDGLSAAAVAKQNRHLELGNTLESMEMVRLNETIEQETFEMTM